MGRGAGASPSASPAACACRAATSTTSPRAIPRCAASRGPRIARGDPRRRDRRLRRGRARPSFERLQQRMHLASEARVRRLASALPVAYVIFDLLYLDGEDLMALPYDERRELLEELELRGPRGRRPPTTARTAPRCSTPRASRGSRASWPSASTPATSPGGAASGWVKVKNVHRQEFVIGGWLPGEGRRSRADRRAARGRARARTGRCATPGGWAPASPSRRSTSWRGGWSPCARDDSPFGQGPRPKGAQFVEPRLVAEVEFGEWTQAGMLRAPSFKGLRDDIARARDARWARASSVEGRRGSSSRTSTRSSIRRRGSPRAT